MAVQGLLLRAHLAEGPPRFRNQKDRVVAEARVASPFGDDLAPAFAFEELGGPAGSGQRDRAHESRQPWPRMSLQPIEQCLRTFLLSRADARGANPWKHSHYIDFDPVIAPTR